MRQIGSWLVGLSLTWLGPAAMALSVFDVIELTRNGYDEAEIERLIEVTNARFVIDVDSLLALGEANVEEKIITLMLERGAQPAQERSQVDQLIALREAGFSEETILLFVGHRNLCEPLADDDARRLGHAGFGSAFMRQFGEQVEDCREQRETLALIEPLPEEAYVETPAEVTRVYQTDQTVYPTTVRTYPTTTYYPPRYYGIYDSYYYHDRITRLYPVVVYRDYSGHKHRHRKAGQRHGKATHRARDNDRRRHDGDRGRAERGDDRRDRRRGDRREDRDRGDRDRPRRRDSDVGPRRPQPRSDPNPRLLVDSTPTDAVIPSVRTPERVRRGVERRTQDNVSTKPFVPSVQRSDRAVRTRSPGLPSDTRRRVERPEPKPNTSVWTTPRPRVFVPNRRNSVAPRYRPPPRTQPPLRPPQTTSVVAQPRTPRVASPAVTRPVAPQPPSVPEPARGWMRKIDRGDTEEK